MLKITIDGHIPNIKQLQTLFFMCFLKLLTLFEAASTECCITLCLNSGQREDFEVYDRCRSARHARS